MVSQRDAQNSPQPLGLPAEFSFAAFRRACPLNDDTIWEVLLERHQQRLTVKRHDKAIDNLRRLFGATFRLANKVGFVSMTLRDLSAETGLSMGGLYGYISSKDDIAEMIEDIVRMLGDILPPWFADVPEGTLRLRATLRGHVFLSELLQPWYYFVFMESRVLSATQRQVAKTAELKLQADLAALIQAAGVVDEVQADLVASHTAAMLQDWVVKRWKYRLHQVSAEVFADSVVAFVLNRVTACQEA